MAPTCYHSSVPATTIRQPEDLIHDAKRRLRARGVNEAVGTLLQFIQTLDEEDVTIASKVLQTPELLETLRRSVRHVADEARRQKFLAALHEPSSLDPDYEREDAWR